MIDPRGVLRILDRRRKYDEFNLAVYLDIQVLWLDLSGDPHSPHRFVFLTAANAKRLASQLPPAAPKTPCNRKWGKSMSNESKATAGGDSLSSEYVDGLYSYALVLTRNYAEAEDLVQETYVRAIPAAGRLRPESNIKAWLFRILRNIWINQLRKRRSDPPIVPSEAESGCVENLVSPGKDSHEVYESKLEVQRVRTAIEQLPLEFREVILLREFEELSYQEIASLLECPTGTVMSRLARARSKLRVLLSPAPANRRQAEASAIRRPPSPCSGSEEQL
jgi:RNA polymerase sigma-70 factor, ECF subfamily